MKWTTQTRKLVELIPHETNPRELTEKQYQDLESSLKRFDLAEIPVINTTNKILAGHQRIKILSMLKGTDHEIEVRVPDRELNADEEKEYLVRSNKNTGQWDFDVLANHFEMDELKDWGFEEIEFAGFSEDTGSGLVSGDDSEDEKKKKKCPECGHEW